MADMVTARNDGMSDTVTFSGTINDESETSVISGKAYNHDI